METHLADWRHRRGLTQEQLAAVVGVTRQTIISLEAGRYNPSLNLAWAVTKAVGAKKVEDVFNLK
jgi:putative transcriptional regulator